MERGDCQEPSPLRLHFDRAGTLTVLAFYRELFAGLSTNICLPSSVQISLFVGTITAEEIFGQCEGSFCLSLSSAIHSSRIAWLFSSTLVNIIPIPAFD